MGKRTLLCGSCKAQKLEDDFYLSKGKPQKNHCKPCARKYAKDRLKDPKKVVEVHDA
jgi:hypothetical protein